MINEVVLDVRCAFGNMEVNNGEYSVENKKYNVKLANEVVAYRANHHNLIVLEPKTIFTDI